MYQCHFISLHVLTKWLVHSAAMIFFSEYTYSFHNSHYYYMKITSVSIV